MWSNGKKKLVYHPQLWRNSRVGSARNDVTRIIVGSIPDTGLRHRGGQMRGLDWHRVLRMVVILDGTPPTSSTGCWIIVRVVPFQIRDGRIFLWRNWNTPKKRSTDTDN